MASNLTVYQRKWKEGTLAPVPSVAAYTEAFSMLFHKLSTDLKAILRVQYMAADVKKTAPQIVMEATGSSAYQSKWNLAYGKMAAQFCDALDFYEVPELQLYVLSEAIPPSPWHFVLHDNVVQALDKLCLFGPRKPSPTSLLSPADDTGK